MAPLALVLGETNNSPIRKCFSRRRKIAKFGEGKGKFKNEFGPVVSDLCGLRALARNIQGATGARSALYETLRVLRAFVVTALFVNG